jgi:hypothetical protein
MAFPGGAQLNRILFTPGWSLVFLYLNVESFQAIFVKPLKGREKLSQ